MRSTSPCLCFVFLLLLGPYWQRLPMILRQAECRETIRMKTFSALLYTVNHKKRDILFLTITLANLNRFLLFLYHFNCEEILHATIVKFITSHTPLRAR